ncbi:trace amine-associated receptor 13c-like, partial [Perca flavescens]|uniref:trace amine-associated receptor 13c-like n=1 Tax=Perca flavescens TaxID=8167 RepID=UPI00106EFEAB
MEVEVGAELCFPQFPNTSCIKPLSPWPQTLTIVFYSISLITVALNLLIILSISHFRQLHTPTNILLLSLAVSDLLVGLVLMPVEVLRKTSCWFLVTVIIALYLRVFAVAVSQARAMRSHITAVTLQLSVTPKAKKSELKAARTLGVLVLVFLICFCPYYCFFIIHLFYLNSCLNPVIYALFYPWFRKAVKLIVTL